MCGSGLVDALGAIPRALAHAPARVAAVARDELQRVREEGEMKRYRLLGVLTVTAWGLLGVALGLAGIYCTDWRFWLVLVLVTVISILSYARGAEASK